MDGTYAPQSPDLSSFFSSPPKTQQPYQPQQAQATSPSTSYAPRSPVVPSFDTSSSQHHNLHYNSNNSNSHNSNSHNINNSNSNDNNNNNQQSAFGGGRLGSEFVEYGHSQYMPPIPALPPTHSFPNTQQSPSAAYFSPQRPPRTVKSEGFSYSELDAEAEDDYHSQAPSNMSSRGPRIKGEPSTSTSTSTFPAQQTQTYKNPNPNNVEIRTKFPVARIKRIMQADEEVGKVAQVTPVAVSKALELFMIALVSGAAEKAREKGGKKVTAQHLKAMVEGNPDQFDFLNDIVGRVSEAQEGAGGESRKRKEKVEVGSDSSEEEKRVKKGRGRRKKEE